MNKSVNKKQTLIIAFLFVFFLTNLTHADYQNSIIASVNRTAITSDDLNNAKSNYPNLTEDELLQQLIFDALVKEEAKRLKVTLTAEETKENPDLPKAELLKQKLAKRIFQNEVQVSSKEIKNKIAEQNLTDFNSLVVPLQITVNADQQSLLKKIKAIKTANKFAAIASKHSLDRYAANGGAIGLLNLDDLNKNVRGILENLQVGEVSEPFKTKQKVTVFFMLQKIQNKAQLEDYFRTEIAQGKFQSEIAKYFSEDIYNKHQIEIYEEE